MSNKGQEPPVSQRDGNPPPSVAQDKAPREIEVKFQADKHSIESLLKSPLLAASAPGASRDLVSIYFDTPERSLHRHSTALRIRKKGRALPVLCVKWPDNAAEGVFSRREIEVTCRTGAPDLQLLEPALGARLAKIVGSAPLQPLFETRVKRRITRIKFGHSEIEVALDEGTIIAGDKREPVHEVELELKTGNQQDLLDFAIAVSEETRLYLDFESKSERGYQLVAGELPKPYRASSLVLSKATNFDDLVAATIAHTVNHFVANWAALRMSDAPEAIHQLRVALRRMRSALGVYRRVIKLAELDDIRSEAKRIASALGPARECDAFRINALAGPLHSARGPLRGSEQLLTRVEMRRKQSYEAARQLMTGPNVTLFVLRVQVFLARRAWRTGISPADLSLLTSEARPYCAAVLIRLHRRAMKRGKQLPDMPDFERHELRIELKNLRYAAEFFGSLFASGKNVRSYLKIVSDLQEDLGTHNDAATAQSFIESLPLPNETDVHFASGFLLGWYRSATISADMNLTRKWKIFKQSKGFWE